MVPSQIAAPLPSVWALLLSPVLHTQMWQSPFFPFCGLVPLSNPHSSCSKEKGEKADSPKTSEVKAKDKISVITMG